MITVEQYEEAGCSLSKRGSGQRDQRDPMFTLILERTQGDPCRTGCAYYDGGRCAAFQRLNPGAPKVPARPVKPKQEQGLRPTKRPFRW